MTVAAGRLEVETPDHIVLRYDLAGAGNRGFAAVLDFAVASLIVFAALMLLSLVASETGDVLYILGGVEVIVTLVLIWSYCILLEWLLNEQTIGKRVYKLRCINEDGSPAQFTAVLILKHIRLGNFLPSSHWLGVPVIV